MLGTPPLSAVLGAGIDNRNHDAVRDYIRELCKLGLAVMLCLPGTKQPADMRTVRTRNKDDKDAQEAAKAAGRADWAKVKSASGLALASTDHGPLLKKNGYLDEYIRNYSTWMTQERDAEGEVINQSTLTTVPTAKQIAEGEVQMHTPVPVNLAIELGQSRVVVVDCDTADQKQRFLEWAAGGQPLSPTVTSPGQIGTEGNPDDPATWIHSSGGHYYFTLPSGVELPENLGAMTLSGEDGYAILWNRRYVLIPPSTRPEGAYRVTGVDYELPQPLLDEIQKAGLARAMRSEQYARRANAGDDVMAAPGDDFGDAIDAWAELISWSDILSPLGWTPAARADNCGCDVWTAGPGHASPKSATAHDTGCTLGRYTEVNTPLHIWTFDPGEPFLSWIKEHGSSTMSKLQVVALTQYGDDMGKTMDALGLRPVDELSRSAGIDANNIAQAAGITPNGLDTPLWGSPAPVITAVTGTTGEDLPGIGAKTLPPSPFADLQSAASTTPVSESAIAPYTALGQTVLDRMSPEQRAKAEEHLNKISEKMADAPETGAAFTAIVQDEGTGAIVEIAVPGGRPIEVPASIACSCGQTVRPDLPGVMPDADGDLWHQAEDGSSHLVELDPAAIDYAAVQEATAVAEAQERAEVMAVMNLDALPTQDSDVPFAAPGDTPQPLPVTPPADTPFVDEAGDPDPAILNTGVFGVPVLAPFSHWRDMPPPEYIIDGLIEHGGLTSIIGAPGMGKSSVALDMACHIATGKRWQGRKTLKTKVLYMPGEGLSGAVQRIAAWEEAHGIEVGDGLILADSILKLQASNEAWQLVGEYVMRQGIGFIIFDTFARMALAVEENSATEVGKAVERFDQVRRYTNAGVLVVHHTGKHSETGRGSSALNGALDSELLIRKGQWDTSQVADANGLLPGKPIELDTTKQKNSEQLDHPIPLMMRNWEPRSAPIITGPGGTVDPMQADIVLARPVAEPTIETAIRVMQLISTTFPEQGVTRTELVNYLAMDAHTAQRGDAAKAWKRKVAEAVDCGLRFDLIETLTGTATGGRYVVGGRGVEAARAAYAASIIRSTSDTSD